MPMEEIATSSEEGSSANRGEIITEEGILCSILSNLPLRDAVRSSVLSTRWRHLWTDRSKLYFNIETVFDAHIVSLLDPDYSPLTKDEIIELLRGKRDQFLESVDSTLRRLQGSEVDEIVVRYFLQSCHSQHLDAWVRFAVSSKTKVLAFYLHKPFCNVLVKKPYGFPCWLLKSSSAVEELTLQCCSLKAPPDFDGLSNLKKLELCCIDVTDEDFIRLVTNCYTLEHLRLEVCPRLVSLRIPQHLSGFHKLVVRDCDHLNEIRIDAVNLKSLFYWGFLVDFIFGDYSQLKDTHIIFKTSLFEWDLESYLDRVSICFPQLQTLSFRLEGAHGVFDPQRESSFLHLKRLHFCWNLNRKMSTYELERLLSASPYLEELFLSFWATSAVGQTTGKLREILSRHSKCMSTRPTGSLGWINSILPIHPHIHIKTVQMDDFCYELWYIRIFFYLLKSAITLESMEIKMDRRGLSETELKNLREEVPAKVKLVIS